jgi:hypothetical protein
MASKAMVPTTSNDISVQFCAAKISINRELHDPAEPIHFVDHPAETDSLR